jgi:hypothetical protein
MFGNWLARKGADKGFSSILKSKFESRNLLPGVFSLRQDKGLAKARKIRQMVFHILLLSLFRNRERTNACAAGQAG